MPLKGLFKSRNTRKFKPDPRIRWFGKLPTYGDYYQSRDDEEWCSELAEWIMRGYELYRGRCTGQDRHPALLPLAACAIRLPKTQMTIFASVLDFGGDMRNRPFPLCFYVGIPVSFWSGFRPRQAVLGTRILNDLLSLRHEVPRFLNSPGNFETAFGGREISFQGLEDANKSTDEFALETPKRLTLGDWYAVVQSSTGGADLSTWLRELERRGEQLAAMKSKRVTPTLRFPLAMRYTVDVQIAGWVHWLSQRIGDWKTISAVITGDPDDQVGQLTLFAHELVPEDFLLVTPLATSLSYLDDLVQICESEAQVEDESSTPGAGERGVHGAGPLTPSVGDFEGHLAGMSFVNYINRSRSTA